MQVAWNSRGGIRKAKVQFKRWLVEEFQICRNDFIRYVQNEGKRKNKNTSCSVKLAKQTDNKI